MPPGGYRIGNTEGGRHMDPGVEMRPEHEGAVEREWDRLFESPLFAQGEPVVFQRVPVLMSWRSSRRSVSLRRGGRPGRPVCRCY